MRIIALILAGGQGERLYPLTRDRAKPAVPFAGIYRIIDFTLSNCINSGLKKIALLTQYKSHSLQRHINSAWNIYKYEFGEYIDIIPPQQRLSNTWYLGTADAIFQNIYLINYEKPEFVLILAGDHIYQMNYMDMINFHINNNADLTVGSFSIPKKDARRFGIMKISNSGEILDFYEKPKEKNIIDSFAVNNTVYVSMGIYVFSTKILIKALSYDFKREDSSHDFGKDIVPRLIEEKYRVFSFPLRTNYWRDIGTINSYFETNLDFIFNNSPILLSNSDWPIRTAGISIPPTRILGRERDSEVISSLISSGCEITNSKIKRSILSPYITMNSAYIEDSIIFSFVNIGKEVKIRKAIIDKYVSIPDGETIGYDLDKDKKRFFISSDGIVVIPKGYVFKNN